MNYILSLFNFLLAQRHDIAMFCYGLVSICLSVTRQYCNETAKRVELVFGLDAIVGISYIVYLQK